MFARVLPRRILKDALEHRFPFWMGAGKDIGFANQNYSARSEENRVDSSSGLAIVSKLKKRYEAGVNSEKRKWALHTQLRDVGCNASLYGSALLFRRLGGGKRFPTPR